MCFSEILHEDKAFSQHDLAALVASKVYYHLGSFEDSLTYALGAGELFDVNARNEYVDTIIGSDIRFFLLVMVDFIGSLVDVQILLQLNVSTIIHSNVFWKLKGSYHQVAKASIRD